MRTRFALLAGSLASIALAAPALAEPFPATLAGHAVIPAETFVDAPADAPADLKTPASSPPASASMPWARSKASRRTPDRREDAVQGPAGAGPFRHQEDGGRHVLGADRQRLRLEGQLARLDALSAIAIASTGARARSSALGTDLPARSRQEGAVPHRQRRHRQALPHRRRFRPRKLPADRRQDLDRRGVRPLPDPRRPHRQGRGGVRDHDRRQAGALARPFRRDDAGHADCAGRLQHPPLQGL